MSDHETPETRMPDDSAQHDTRLTKTLLWIGVAGLGAALAFTLVRALATRRAPDPTSVRIQGLIDEANALLRTLDEQRGS